jgi:hypothetical protein
MRVEMEENTSRMDKKDTMEVVAEVPAALHTMEELEEVL